MSALTDSQKIDALYQKFVTGAPPTPVIPTTTVRWWAPTDAEATGFGAKIGWTVHDLYGNRQANDSGPDPLVVASDGSVEDAKLYAKFGFNVLGQRVLWHSDNRESTVKLIDRLAACKTGQEADDIMQGAGYMDLDCAAFLLLNNQVTGGGLLGSPRLGFFGTTTIADAVAKMFAMTTRRPGDPGIGVAG